MNKQKKGAKESAKSPKPPEGPKPVIVDPAQVSESLQTLLRLTNSITGRLTTLCGLSNQATQFNKLVELLEQELEFLLDLDSDEGSSANEAARMEYSLQDIYLIEQSLTSLAEFITRLQPAGFGDEIILLKEMRTLLSVGYERQNLLYIYSSVLKALESLRGFNQRHNQEIMSGKLMDRNAMKGMMQKDETQIIPILQTKCNEIKAKSFGKDFSSQIDTMLKFVDAASKFMTTLDTLDIDEVQQFDKSIRKKILEMECNIPEKALDISDELYEGVQLGQGVFGPLGLATLKNGGKKEEVFLKTLYLDEEIAKDECVELTNELAQWRTISHPCIQTCFGMALTKESFRIVVERVEYSLHDHLHERNKTLSKAEQRKLAKDVSIGLLQLHVFNILHRNLSAKTICLGANGFRGAIKLTEFGLGNFKYNTQFHGPSVYTPPEVLVSTDLNYNNHSWTSKGDVYALGLILWEAGQENEIPFAEEKYNLHQYVGIDKNVVDMSKGTHESWVKPLIKQCTYHEPALRPDAFGVCQAIIEHCSAAGQADMEKAVNQVKESTKQAASSAKGADNRSVASSSRSSEKQNKRASVMVVGDRVQVLDPFEAKPAPPPGGPPSSAMYALPPETSSIRRNVISMRVQLNDLKRSDAPPPGLGGPRLPSMTAPKAPSVSNSVKGPRPPSGSFAHGHGFAENFQPEEREDSDDDDGVSHVSPSPGLKGRPSKRNVKSNDEEMEVGSFGDDDDFGDDDEEDKPQASSKEVEKARKKKALMKLAVQKTSNPKKVSAKIKALPETVMKADRLEFSQFFTVMTFTKRLGDIDCEVISNILLWNSKLVRVIIENQKVTNKGVDALAAAVAGHPRLLQLFLGGNKGITQVDKLLKALLKNKTLEVLSLDNCKISDIGAKELGRFLDRQNFLLELDVSFNAIGSDGMAFLAKGLENNNSLKGLIVSDQSVSCGRGMRKLRKVAKTKGIKLNKRHIS